MLSEEKYPKHMQFMDLSLLFENDEGEYLVLNNYDSLCLRIAITSAKTIPGTDIHRLKLRVFEGSSPSIKAPPNKTDGEGVRKFGPQKRVSLEASYSKPIASNVREEDKTGTSGEELNDIDDDDDEAKTPLERYVLSTEQ